MRQQIEKWQPDLMVLDESHKIKSSSAARSRTIHALSDVPRYKVIATGTVLTKRKRVFDVYSQWKFLNPDRFGRGTTFTDFREEYGVWSHRHGFPLWLRNRNVAQLKRLMHMDAFAIRREECFDLPGRTDQIVHVDLIDSAPAYVAMAKDLLAEFEDGDVAEASIPLVQILRLSQLTSGFVGVSYPEKKIRRVGTEKLEAAKDLLEDWFEAEEKVVVGARWIPDILALEELGKKLKVPVDLVYGGKRRGSKELNQAAIETFQRKRGPRMMVMQPAVGSLGIDLRQASIFLWYSLTSSWVDYTQAEDRIALNPNPKSYVTLVARGTVDEGLYASLKEDGRVVKWFQEHPDSILSKELERQVADYD